MWGLGVGCRGEVIVAGGGGLQTWKVSDTRLALAWRYGERVVWVWWMGVALLEVIGAFRNSQGTSECMKYD